MKAFKGFDKNFQCRGFQFEVGKTYKHEGKVEACQSGFHSCENPLDVLNYYDIAESRFATVEVSGETSKHGDDSKIASAEIHIQAELKLPEFIKNAVQYLIGLAACNDSIKVASGDYSQLAASGDSSQLAASGYSSQLAASGDYSQLAASGYYSKLAASGYSSQLTASGDYSQLAASGDYSQLAASGYYSQLAASGYSSKLAASGDSSIAVAAAPNCKAKAGKNGCIALAYWVNEEKRFRMAVGYVGENGIEADTWYRVDNGELVAA